MSFLVRKPYDLVFKGRAVTRTDAFDDTGIHAGAVEVRFDDLFCFFCRVCEITRQLFIERQDLFLLRVFREADKTVRSRFILCL